MLWACKNEFPFDVRLRSLCVCVHVCVFACAYVRVCVRNVMRGKVFASFAACRLARELA